ncbi:kinetochore-associated Ndc80 complex subunit nuf2 [Phlyctochytrium bullatum]|nr:kinetochore-associated Ndc80 complex subunit nuf2 [Phlyctochytrium bullatum]
MSMEDLEKPSTARVLAILEQFTEILMGVTRDQYSQLNFSAMEILEFPDLHQESIVLMAFYRQLARLVIEVGIPDFNVRDVIKPEAARLRRILSAIINFAKFREERLSVFEHCTQKSVELAEKVNTMKLRRAEEEPALLVQREKSQQLTAILRDLKRSQLTLTEEIDMLKKTKSEISEKLV